MKKAMAIEWIDISGAEGAAQLCKALHESLEHDSEEDHKLLCTYVYNILRKQFNLDNVLQLVGNEDLSMVAIIIYDCKPCDLKGPSKPVEDSNQLYLEIEE